MAGGSPGSHSGLTNGTIPLAHFRPRQGLGGEVAGFLHQAIDRLALSPRAYERVVRVARTIADLDGAPDILVAHVAEAIEYRTLDRARAPVGIEAE